jgi:hypothetical protein
VFFEIKMNKQNKAKIVNREQAVIRALCRSYVALRHPKKFNDIRHQAKTIVALDMLAESIPSGAD